MHFLRTLKPPRLHRRGVVHALPKIISIAGAVAIGAHFGWPLMSQAESDTAAPVFDSASYFNGTTFDISDGGAYARVVINSHDNLSGLATPRIKYVSPSGRQSQTGGCDQGDNSNQYICSLDFPQYAEAGSWLPEVTLSDHSGNLNVISSQALVSSGNDIRLTLTGTSDTTPVTLNGVSASKTTLAPTASSTDTVKFVTNMTDNLSGVGVPTLYFTSPSGNQTVNTGILGTDDNNNFILTADFVSYSETGTWVPTLSTLDHAGNTQLFTSSALLAKGIDLRLKVTGSGDTTMPTVKSLKISVASPAVDSIPIGGAVITLAGDFADSMSGVANPSFQYVSPSGKQHSDYTYFTPDENNIYKASTFLPAYSEAGKWTAQLKLPDRAGNMAIYTGAQLSGLGYPVDITVGKSITTHANAGDTISSDSEGDGATASDPVEVAVTTPLEGDVSIVTVSSDSLLGPTNGYNFFGRQINIVAPQNTVSNPLTLAFRIDSSQVPVGQSEATIQMTRNGALIAPCNDQTTANPDPCIFSRTKLSDGDILVKIHSTTASSWSSGFPTSSPGASYQGPEGFTLGDNKLNRANSGSIVPVMFGMANTESDDVIADGYPTYNEVSCVDLKPLPKKKAAVAKSALGITRIGSHYVYWWRTSPSFKNSCQALNMKFIDGSTQTLYYKFVK